MKEFIKNNSKPLIYTIGIMITAITITLINYSYAAGGNNSIYTRDELSELIENEQYKGDMIELITGVITIPENEDVKMPVNIKNSYNEEIFSFNDGTITLNKSGNYQLTMFINGVFRTSGWGQFHNKKSGAAAFADFHEIEPGKINTFSISSIYKYPAGTTIDFYGYITATPISMQTYYSMTYIGE